MNWEAITAAIEFVGVVAVLASILYLARQVSQGNKLNQSDSIRNFLAQYNAFLYQIGDPDFIEIWRRGTTDFGSLGESEKSRLHTVLLGHYMLGQAQRLIDPDGNEELSKFADWAIAATVSQPGVRQWWNTFKGALPDQEYVSRLDNYPGIADVTWEEFLPWYVVELEKRKPS